jgi:hypothetical protein
VAVRWILSHEGIEGNEVADIAAKEATGWRDRSERGLRADLPTELYTLKPRIRCGPVERQIGIGKAVGSRKRKAE